MRLAGHGKKVLSLVLAAAMTASLATTAWADDVTDSNAGTQDQQVSSASSEEKQQNESSVTSTEEEKEEGASSASSSEEKKKEESVSSASSEEEKEEETVSSASSEEEQKEETASSAAEEENQDEVDSAAAPQAVVALANAAPKAGTVNEDGTADLNDVNNWISDRTEPLNFAIADGKITFGVSEQEAANKWYNWQGRKGYTGVAASDYWKVDYSYEVTDEMLQGNHINQSMWIQVDTLQDTVESQNSCVDWSIVQFINNDGTAQWQVWSSEGAGAWKDAGAATAGEHTITTEFANGTITQSIDGQEVNSYAVSAAKTSPAALIAQGRTYGEAFDVTFTVPTISTAVPETAGVAQIGDVYYASLDSAFAAAKSGDTIRIAEGSYTIGNVTLKEDVSLQGAGADKTVLQGGTILYGNTGDTHIDGKTINVQGIGFDTENQMALCFSTGVTNSTLNVTDCTFANCDYAVNVNSAAAGNTLAVKNVAFNNTWCGVAVKDGNTFTQEGITVNEGVVFPVQKFGTDSGNKYYLDTAMTEYVDAAKETVTAGQTFTKAASIGSAYYSSLASAFAAAADGETITLLADADNVGKLVLSDGRTITVNLNGHDVAFQSNCNFRIQHGTLNLEGAGTAYEKAPYFAPVTLYGTTANEQNYSVINVGKDVTLRGWSSVFIDKNGNYANGVVANVAGTLQSVKDTTGAYGHAVYVQGTITNVDDTYAPQIHLLSTARIQAVDEEDATKGSNGMYLAGYAVTTIDAGASIESGAAGIEIRAGKLTVNGGTIESTAIPTSVTPNGNGSTTEGAAVAVSQHTTALPLEVTINGGTFRGYTALYENCVEDSNKPELVKVTVNGGNFAATNGGVNSVYADEPETMTVSGGYYTNEVNSAYIKDETLACNLLSEKYEGVYGYQVAEKVKPDAVEVQVSVAEPSVDTDAKISTDNVVDRQEVVTAAETINIAQNSEVDVMIAAKNQATLDGQKLDSEKTLAAATEALEKKNVTVDENTEVTILVEPKLSIIPMAGTASNTERSMTFDVKLVYDIKATTDPDNQVLSAEEGTVNTVYLAQNVTLPKAPTMDITLGGLAPIEIGEADAAKVYVQHDHEGTLHYYKPNVTVLDQSNTYVDSVTFTNPNGFSEIKVYMDPREAVLQVENGPEITVTPDMIGGNIASLPMAGYTFQGLQIEGVSGTQLVLTSDLMDTLSKLYADKKAPLTATAIYTKNSSGSGSSSTTTTTTNNNTTTTTQSGPTIEYYTCPACGYHNWTATATGYKCDHCGYVESTKQLSSYGNVKGVYDPQSAAAQASATSVQGTIPQTSDDMPLVGLVVVAVAALLGLGVTVVMKKRNTH